MLKIVVKPGQLFAKRCLCLCLFAFLVVTSEQPPGVTAASGASDHNPVEINSAAHYESHDLNSNAASLNPRAQPSNGSPNSLRPLQAASNNLSGGTVDDGTIQKANGSLQEYITGGEFVPETMMMSSAPPKSRHSLNFTVPVAAPTRAPTSSPPSAPLAGPPFTQTQPSPSSTHMSPETPSPLTFPQTPSPSLPPLSPLSSSTSTPIGVGSQQMLVGIGVSSDEFLPVIIVPGISGSGLFAEIKNASLPNCSSQLYSHPRHRVWASLKELLPPEMHQQCWADKIKMEYDKETNTFKSIPGITISVDDPEGVTDFEYLDYALGVGVPGLYYFRGLLKTLREYNYVDKQNLFGFPYDWRLPPWQIDWRLFKSRIEHAYTSNGNKRVIIICHSLGCLMTSYFLSSQVVHHWKEQHVAAFIAAGGAFAGSFKSIRMILSGYNDPVKFDFWNIFDFAIISTKILKSAFDTFGSVYALLPNPAVYGEHYEVIRVQKAKTLSSNKDGIFSENCEGDDCNEQHPVAIPSLTDADELSTIHEPKRRELSVVSEADSFSRNLRESSILNTDGYDVSAVDAGTDGPGSHALARDYHSTYQTMTIESAEKSTENQLGDYIHPENKVDSEYDVYTLEDWAKLLPEEMGERARQALLEIKDYAIRDPGIPTVCLWSKWLRPSTEVRFQYESYDFEQQPISLMGDGDDTVELSSLKICSGWTSTVQSKEFENLDHMRILSDKTFIDTVLSNIFTFAKNETARRKRTNEAA